MVSTGQGILGCNMFAYCNNNPVVREDDDGKFWHIVIGAVIGGVIGAVSSIVGQAAIGNGINWSEVGVSAASGLVSGAITAACPGLSVVATGVIHGAIGSATYAPTELVNGRSPSTIGTIATGITSGLLAGGIKAFSNYISSTKLYRSVCQLEADGFSNTGNFSIGNGSMEGKFFATTKANAQQWGSKLGSNCMITISVPKSALNHSSVIFFPRLDGIGPAYYFESIDYLNSIMLR